MALWSVRMRLSLLPNTWYVVEPPIYLASFLTSCIEYNHPEGVTPYMLPRGEQPLSNPMETSFYSDIVKQCSEFHQMTGKIGDVILVHPLMVHSVSVNGLRHPRVITNPPAQLKKPFNFDRSDPTKYSLVEKKTLSLLGKERLAGWKIQGQREYVTPERLK